jgi:hypothetical protein
MWRVEGSANYSLRSTFYFLTCLIRLGDLFGEELDGGFGGIIADDGILDLVEVAVGACKGDDGDIHILSFLNGVLFAADVYDKESIGLFFERHDAVEHLFECGDLFVYEHALALGVFGELALFFVGNELLIALDALPDLTEVGHGTADPATVDIGHVKGLRGGLHCLRSLFLAADEEDGLAFLREGCDESLGLLEEVVGLFEVDDVGRILHAEDVVGYGRVPARTAEAEMSAGCEHGFDGFLGIHKVATP